MRQLASIHFKLTNPYRSMLVVTDRRSQRDSVDSGRVVAYRHSAILYGVAFKVSAGAQRRIASGGARSVHAQAWGTIESVPGRINPSETLADHPELTVEVRYNPKRAPWFHRLGSDGELIRVDSAPMVGFSTASNGQGRCWIAPPRQLTG